MVSIGETNPKTFTLNFMKRILTDETMIHLSYTGKNGFKEERTNSFGRSQICESTHVAAKKTFKRRQMTKLSKP